MDDDTPPVGLAHAATMAGRGVAPADEPVRRYSGTQLLGRGGMGEVVKVTDHEIGRDIAIKRMRDPHAGPELTERFLREGRIQARLEHPGIVPVYELGHDAEGHPYFTMKRVGGTTLADVLAADDAPARRRALRALVEVALAIDYAHRHGVVHRDLKPANIMLGDFGEVHVLDWGVARVLGNDAPGPEPTPAATPVPAPPGDRRADYAADAVSPVARPSRPGLDSATRAGDIVGTPGYMAPEQARGEPVTHPADVYALGAVLYEVLAGVPLHPRGLAALETTLAGVTVGPRARCPERDVAPELDALCLDAIAAAAPARPTARTFADRLLQYLDGDRDLERRRTLARAHLTAARAGTADADAGGSAGDLDAHTRALREAGRALALDPELVEAADLVEELRRRPLDHAPPEVERVIAEVDLAATKKQAGMAARALLAGCAGFSLLAIVIGVRSWTEFIAFQAVTVLVVGSAVRDARTGSLASALTSVACCGLLIAVAERAFGPFVLVPSLLAASTTTLAAYPPLRRRPWTVVGVLVLGLVVPLALEIAGVLAPTFDISHGTITSYSSLALDGWTGAALLVGVTLLTVAATGTFHHRWSSQRRDAQTALAMQAWTDRQLSPTK